MLKALALTAAIAIAAPALANPVVGQAAPAFRVTDSNGKARSLAEFKGKTVVLEWTNAECPFVKKHYAGNMQALQKSAAKDGIVWLKVNSGAPGKQGHVDGAGANAIVKAKGAAPTAYLLDAKGDVGRAYAAKTTPHMYIVDPAGKLVYMGGIDDTPTADVADIKTAKNYVTAALADLKAKRAVQVASSKPYGCSVKYAG
ncbi:MAG: redoxin domain-containing protein [Sphingomonadaceae bacterium]|nr:redoxin domain-containing protein [Sphingomonadaceae bacterium]